MKQFAVILCLLAIFGISFALEESFESYAKREFIKFARKYEKMYLVEGQYFDKRFEVFKENLKRLENIQDNSAQYGITKFMDLTPEEFASIYRMRTPTANNYLSTISSFPKAESVSTDKLPKSFDWRSKGAVTHVKNQGMCGSCWAFSTTGNVEGRTFLATNSLPDLSEQNLVDCSHNCAANSTTDCNQGCNGGWPYLAYQYIMKQGIDTEKAYPYDGSDGSCRFQPGSVGAHISSWEAAPSDEKQLAAYLVNNGPISVAMNAEWLQFYVGGVSDPWFCDPKKPDHGVLLVGFGVEKNILGHEEEYWLVKNSWGSDWGESGYFKLIRNKGKCGINLYATSAIV
eukprot:gb/GECH01006112.1/.p1 GENE.gb/GECH01006112.1/~~gb/GECH01006112.1/.p1  ORF type:complete len:343 (+),score=58.24 gb/GECH01006112.1/:1-1029(+)